MHGGSVQVASEGVDRGTTFTVELPMAVTPEVVLYEAPPESEEHPLRERFSELKDLRVLVVDDEPDTRLLLATIIESCGASVKSADSASEAFALMEKFKPDLLISDIAMPIEDGYSLIRRVRELSPDKGGKIQAIALTAYAREEDRLQAFNAGFQMHLSKPVEPDELLEAIKELVTPETGNSQSH
jgi:CheY-like chemotaxis protein